MAIQPNQQLVWQWVTSDSAATPENFLELLQEFENSIGLPMSQADVNLTNSPTGINLTGRLSDVRSEFEGQGKPEFAHGSFNLAVPPSGVSVQASLEFGRRFVSINLGPGATVDGDRMHEVARRFFPKADGPSPRELSAKDARLAQLLGLAESTVASAAGAKTSEEQAAASAQAVVEALTTAQSTAQAVQTAATSVATHEQATTETLARIKAVLAESQSYRESAKTASDEAGPLLETIKAFAATVDAESKKLRQLHSSAGDELGAAEKRSTDVLTRHEQLQSQIAEALQRAVGVGLFGAFNQRRRQIVRSKWVWLAIAVAAGGAQVWEIYWLAGFLKEALGQQPFPLPAFLLRATASLPILFFLGLGIRQYGRERDIEEVYAFKSALSFSFKPYLDLVESLPNLDGAKHQEFITTTIHQVFDYPAEKVRETRGARRGRRGVTDIEQAVQTMLKLRDLFPH